MSFQPGDYIRCNLSEQYLTVGKVYKVIKISDIADIVEITSDIGMNYFYPILCFCKVNPLKEKPEFKVDKLGWYRARNNNLIKIVHKMKPTKYRPDCWFGVSEDNTTDEFYCDDGSLDEANKQHKHLVEYIGTELPKEPVTFEFVIEVINVSDTHLEVISGFDDSGIKEGIKYKIIMQEIVE